MATLAETIAHIAVNANVSGKPVEFFYGTVQGEKPLVVFIDSKQNIDEDFLVLTSAVKDRYVDITVSFKTGMIYEKDGLVDNHNHKVDGTKRMLVHNGLKTGERVLLARVQGGQKYIVLDRVSEGTAEGEWIE